MIALHLVPIVFTVIALCLAEYGYRRRESRLRETAWDQGFEAGRWAQIQVHRDNIVRLHASVMSHKYSHLADVAQRPENVA